MRDRAIKKLDNYEIWSLRGRIAIKEKTGATRFPQIEESNIIAIVPETDITVKTIRNNILFLTKENSQNYLYKYARGMVKKYKTDINFIDESRKAYAIDHTHIIPVENGYRVVELRDKIQDIAELDIKEVKNIWTLELETEAGRVGLRELS